MRQSELLKSLAPVQNPPAFGLDALYVITDATPSAPAPGLSVALNRPTQSALLSWQGLGRVFRVEATSSVTGPFQALSPIIPELNYEDTGVLTQKARSFYRLRQW